MKIIISNINPTDMETVRNILLEHGKKCWKPLNVQIPPNMKSMFEAAFANRYWSVSEMKWKLPSDVSGEFYFALDDSTEKNRDESWSDLIGHHRGEVVCGIVRLSTHAGPRTIVIEECGEFQRQAYGNTIN